MLERRGLNLLPEGRNAVINDCCNWRVAAAVRSVTDTPQVRVAVVVVVVVLLAAGGGGLMNF